MFGFCRVLLPSRWFVGQRPEGGACGGGERSCRGGLWESLRWRWSRHYAMMVLLPIESTLKFVRFVVLLAVLISLGLGTSCVTKDTRKKKWVHIGGSWGLHWAYFATPPLRFEIPGETFPFGAEYDSSSGKVLGIGDTFEVSNQGTYVRYFPGNSFNILLGAFSWTFKSDSWSVLNSSWQTVTYKVNNKITDVGIASATSGWATGAAPSRGGLGDVRLQ